MIPGYNDNGRHTGHRKLVFPPEWVVTEGSNYYKPILKIPKPTLNHTGAFKVIH
jgi:hypothetical protein